MKLINNIKIKEKINIIYLNIKQDKGPKTN